MGERTCSIRGCNKKRLARELCKTHYQRAWKTGTLPPVQMEIPLREVHELSNLNRETATADCLVCGPNTPVRLRPGKRSSECQIMRAETFARLRGTSPEERREVKLRYRLRHKYRITMAEYESLASRQAGLCAICQSGEFDLVVDHDHATGKVRGLLCRNCNLALGYLRDSPKAAVAASEYLLSQ